MSPLRPWPPELAVNWSRQLAPKVVGTVSYHTGWPIFPLAADISKIPRQELVRWISSTFAIGINCENWTLGLDMKGASGETVISAQRVVRLSDTTELELNAALNPLNPPAALSITIGATQSWKDLIKGGLTVGLHVRFQLGGVVLQVR